MRRPTVQTLLVAAIVATGAWGTAWAQAPATAPANEAAPAAGQLQFKTERVVVFKDGYALVIKAASATADGQGRVFTAEVPPDAVLGCFWAAGDSAKILAMKSEWRDSKRVQTNQAPALTMNDLLRANIGKKVTLTLTDDNALWGRPAGPAHTVTGTLAEILETAGEPDSVAVSDGRGGILRAEPSSARSPFENPSTEATLAALARDGEIKVTRETAPLGGVYVVLDGTETGRMVLPVANVRSVGGDGLATHAAKDEEVFTRGKRLSFELGAALAGKAAALHLFYFTPGIRWIPTYRVTGELTDKADLALQGEIVNDLEDIDHAAMDLVVGVPNFRFKQAESPLTLERAMRATMMNLDNNSQYGNGYSSQMLNNGGNALVQLPRIDLTPIQPTRPPAGPGELAGTSEQDLFVYPLKDFSLAKNSRASMPLWQSSVPLKHLYTFDLTTRRSRSTGGKLNIADNSARGNSPLQLTTNPIWHQLELTNASETPWTTGAALMLKAHLPLGQDILTYTSPGGSALIPVTVAVDLRATSDEEEVERHNAALHVDGYDYAVVKKKGTITITNYRKEKSTLRVTSSTGGKVETASDEGKIKLNEFRPDDWDDSSYMRPNNHSDVIWEFTLDAGQSKTLTYTLSSYVR